MAQTIEQTIRQVLDWEYSIQLIGLNSNLGIYSKETENNWELPISYWKKHSNSINPKIPTIIITHHRLQELDRRSNSVIDDFSKYQVVLGLSGDIHRGPKKKNEIEGIRSISSGSLLISKKYIDSNIPNQFNVYDLDLQIGKLNIKKFIFDQSWILDSFKEEFLSLNNWNQFIYNLKLHYRPLITPLFKLVFLFNFKQGLKSFFVSFFFILQLAQVGIKFS